MPNLVTTANDGVVRIWDLSKIVKAGGPKEILKAPNIHDSGIFSMDSTVSGKGAQSSQVIIATGSKDKSVAVTALVGSGGGVSVMWRGRQHDKQIKNVGLCKEEGSSLVAACGDDGLVSVCDYRAKGSENSSSVCEISNGHAKPCSVVWGDGAVGKNVLMTAGTCSDVIKLWDIRKADTPTTTLRGHTAVDLNRRSIHHPIFYSPIADGSGSCAAYVISGGDKVGGLSMFEVVEGGGGGVKGGEVLAYSRGSLGEYLDPQYVAVEKDHRGYGFRVAAAVSGGYVHLLKPAWKTKNINA